MHSPQRSRRKQHARTWRPELLPRRAAGHVHRVSAEHRFARHGIGQEQFVQRSQLASRCIREHHSRAARWMPEIGMLRQPHIFVTIAERHELQSGASDHIFEVRIRDDLHTMPALGQRTSEAHHRMDVAVAAQCGNDEMRHTGPVHIKLVTISVPPHNGSTKLSWLSTLDSQLLTAMNDPDRDKFYSKPSAPPDDDDADYELEPVDPEIASAEERRAKEVAEYVKTSINIDDIYREAERNRGTEILEDWARNFKFRF